MADGALALLGDAREKVDRSKHKAEINLDISDAMRYLESIKRLMVEAGIGED